MGKGRHFARRCAIDVMHSIRAEIENEEDEEQKNVLRKHLSRSESDGILNSMLNIARDLPEFRIGSNELDSISYLLKVRNGIICLGTGEREEDHPSYLVTKEVPILYDEDAECPVFMKFLYEILMGDDDLISYVQRAVGYTLTGDNSEQCMFLLYGDGANGKSVLQNVITMLLGEYCIAAPPQMLVSRTRSATNDLATAGSKNAVTI